MEPRRLRDTPWYPMLMRLHQPVFLSTLLMALCCGCAPVDLEGSWSGTWRTTLAIDSGTITISLEQDGDAISGTFALEGTHIGTGTVHQHAYSQDW